MAAPRSLPARRGGRPAGPDGDAAAARQAEHYARLLARAFESGDRSKLNRCASEYPSLDHPLPVRRLAARVRHASRALLDVLDGVTEVPEGQVIVVVVHPEGPVVELRPLAPAVALRRGRPAPARRRLA